LIDCSILIENIKFSTWAGSLFINGAAPTFFLGMLKCYTGAIALFSTLHTSHVGIEFAGKFRRHDSSAITCDFSMIKTHPEVLTAHSAFKTGISTQCGLCAAVTIFSV